MKSTETHVRNKITILTFISSIIVIYAHAYNLSSYGIGNGDVGLGYVAFCIENFMKDAIIGRVIPLFFFISGLLFLEHSKFKTCLENGNLV